MTLSPADARHAVIRTSADLPPFWAALMGDGGFSRRTLWVAFFDEDGRPLPTLWPIDEVPRIPGRFVEQLSRILTEAIADAPVTAIATLLSRPGPAEVSGSDRRWATALRVAAESLPITCWPLHLATEDRVTDLAPD
jgi:hypothetical protein